jgi:hypothetical protein
MLRSLVRVCSKFLFIRLPWLSLILRDSYHPNVFSKNIVEQNSISLFLVLEMLLTATIASVFDVAIVVKNDATYLCVRGTHVLQSTMYSKYWVFDQICFCKPNWILNGICAWTKTLCATRSTTILPRPQKKV